MWRVERRLRRICPSGADADISLLESGIILAKYDEDFPPQNNIIQEDHTRGDSICGMDDMAL